MLPYNLNPGPESLRWLGIAEKLLNNRDFIGSKTFATRARDSDPNLDEADQILAIVDTLIAGEKQISANHLDWYAILQLARRTHDSELIASQYHRLGVLLNPNRNKFAFAEHAFKFVAEAWLVLSNPSRKFQFDNEFGNSNVSNFNFMQQQHYEHNNNISSSSSSGTQFNFMQQHSEQLHQSTPMQQLFVQQELFPQQQQYQTQPLSQQLHWSNTSQQPLFRPQSQPTWLQQPQPQQPLHWSQVQQSLPDSWTQPQLQPEKTPFQSRERVENGVQFNLGRNGGFDDSRENNVNVEELPNFWTACAYCYHMYEYSGVYAECTLRCQNCKKAFHAVRVEAPPDVEEGEDACYHCWGFVPVGMSPSFLEKCKAGASSWTPFSTMFGSPQGGYTGKPKNMRNSGPRTYIDDGENIFDGISSNEESDDDWGSAPKNKKGRSSMRKVSTVTKVMQPQVYRAEKVQESNMGNLQSGVVAQEGPGVSVPNAAVPSVPDAAVPDAAVPSVPVTEAKKKAVVEADKNAVGETSKRRVAVPRQESNQVDLERIWRGWI